MHETDKQTIRIEMLKIFTDIFSYRSHTQIGFAAYNGFVEMFIPSESGNK